MTFVEHLAELRNRLAIAIGAVLVIGLVAFPLMSAALNFIRAYFLRGMTLNVFSPAETIQVELKLSVLVGIVLGLPVILYETYAFVAPALDRRVRSRILWYAIPSLLMSALGIGFGGFIVLPFVIKALLQFNAGAGVTPVYQLDATVGFVALLLGVFALIFQLPIVLSLLASVGLVNSRFLIDKWRHATVIMVIIAAIAAPDGSPLTMGLLAAPLLALYVISIAVVHITQPKIAAS